MAAVQEHGFAHEDRIIRAKTGLSKKELGTSYTGIHDIPAGIYESQDGSIKEVKYNTSIKTAKGNIVSCSDIKRFFRETSKDEELELHIALYTQSSPKTKSFHTIYVFKLSKEHKKKLWGDISEEILLNFCKYVKNIAPGKEAQIANQELWKEKRKAIVDEYGQGIVQIAAKIGKTNQRRTQCTFNINQMIEEGIPYEVYTEEYEGIPVKYDYDSSSRTFK